MITKNRLREIRQERGIAQQWLAAHAGCSPSKLTSIERYNYLPSRGLRQRIAEALETTPEEIWPGLDEGD
ncbi:MAG: helix-turn-helix transcriptional regulator [Chloroflexi bacterium]|nr:helix-turn-helix transcriptional regulator [Chloroflexota bacterium]